MYTSQTRMTGFSGMDVDSMVQSLMEAESVKLYNMQRKSQIITWKQEAYRKIGNSLKSFQSTYLNYTNSNTNMLSSSAFGNFKTSVTSSLNGTSSAINVRTSSSAKKGTYDVKVLKTATTAAVTGNKATSVTGKESLDFDTNFKDLDDDAVLSFKATYNGTEKTIELRGSEVNGLASLSEVAEVINTKLASSFGVHDDAFNYGGFPSGIKNKLWVSFDGGVMSFNAAEGATFSVKSVGTESLLDIAGIKEDASNKISLADTLENVLGSSGDFKININGTDIELKDTDSITDVMNKINASEAGVIISRNSLTGAFTLTASESGASGEVKFDLTGDNNKILKGIFGFSEAKSEKGSDSVISINGTLIQSASNTVTISDYGLTLELSETTAAEETLTINVDTDVDATFNKIKAFVDTYNEMLSAIQDEVKTTRPKSDKYTYYEPLLDSEKESLSETEIEKYEEKAKKGLLYNDSTIKGIISKLRDAMSTPVTLADGSKISLSSIGISISSDYSKGGVLIIDESKLKEAIASNSDAVTKLFTSSGDTSSTTGIARRLNSVVDGATHHSTGTITKVAGFENSMSATSNTMYKQLKDMKSKMDLMTDILIKKENAYYKKFSAMESAMAKADNQLNSLASMLGTK